MTNIIKSFGLIAAGLMLGLTTTNASSAQAATINYNFEVSIDSGSLVGETFLGSFSFDDATLTGSGSESLPISTLEVSFQGTTYTEANASGKDRIRFLDNDFLGLSFSPNPSFAFIPGFFNVNEAFFAYDIAQGEIARAGAGDIGYFLQPIPEPRSVIGILTLSGWGVIYLLKHQKKSFRKRSLGN